MTKKEIWSAIEQLNELDLCPAIRCKSKPIKEMVDTTSKAISIIPAQEFLDTVPEELVTTLVEAGVLLPDLEEEAPKKKGKKKKKKAKTETPMAGGGVTEEAADPEEEAIDEKVFAIKNRIQALSEKLDGAKKKKKAKIEAKIQKLITALAAFDIQKDQPKAKKPAKKAPVRKGPGVIKSIQKVLEDTKKPLTVEKVLKKLCKIIPEGDPEKMVKTVRAQLNCRKPPCRLEKEKGCKVIIDGEGKSRTFIIEGD